MKTLLCLAVLSVLLTVSYGLSCYTCENDDVLLSDPEACDDTFVEKADLYMKCNATAGERFCRKQKKGVNHIYNKITRGCASMCEEQNVAYINRVTCCDSDGCNAGHVMTPSVVALGLTGLLLIPFLRL